MKYAVLAAIASILIARCTFGLEVELSREKTLQLLAKSLEDEDPENRLKAVDDLSDLLKSNDENALNIILIALWDSDQRVVSRCVDRCYNSIKRTPENFQRLIAIAASYEFMRRVRIVKEIHELDFSLKLIAPTLIKTMTSTDQSTRDTSAQIVATFELKGKPLVDNLTSLQHSEPLNSRLWASYARWKVSEDPMPLANALNDIVGLADLRTQRKMNEFLKMIDPDLDQLSLILVQNLQGEKTDIPSMPVSVLGRIGDRARESLIKGTRHESENVRILSLRAMSAAGLQDESTMNSIAKSLEDKSELVRMEACRAAYNLNKPNEKCAEALTLARADPNEKVRILASKAIEKFLSSHSLQSVER